MQDVLHHICWAVLANTVAEVQKVSGYVYTHDTRVSLFRGWSRWEPPAVLFWRLATQAEAL